MIYKRWQLITIAFAVLLGILAALPNVLSPEALSYVPFARQIYLGLDLRGGMALQLRVDIPAAERERVQGTRDSVRRTLRTARIQYRDLRVAGSDVGVTLLDPAKTDEARRLLDQIAGTGLSTPDYSIADDGRGGLTLRATDAATRARADDMVQRSIEIIRRRVDETGLSEPTIARQGSDRIRVELPGVQDPDRIKKLLGETAKMTFRLVDTEANPTGAIPPEDELLYEKDKNGQRTTSWVIEKRVAVSGERLVSATAGFDSRTSEPVVEFQFDSRGAREFGNITRTHVGKPFAIVLDDVVLSAPVIQEPILGGRGQISGNFTTQTANDLAILLRAGALPAPLKIIEERTVRPTLGEEAIQLGIQGCIIGGALVIVFMLFFYRWFGVLASIGMVINLILLLGVLSLLQASLTLPGLVGILLTLGMSVDANVLINERIREEARKGRSALSAIQTGFSRAMSTIIDANVTTLLKMMILYVMAIGAVRGFAITISIGILTSMFTAIVLVRLMIETWYRRARPKSLDLSNRWLFGPRLVPDNTGVRFMRARHAGLITSAVLSIGSLILAFYPGLNLGIDFKGGIAVQAHLPKPVGDEALHAQLDKLGLGIVQIQQYGNGQDVTIRIQRQPGDDSVQQEAASRVRNELTRVYGPQTLIQSVDAVGATVSGELFQAGLLALAAAMVAMLMYIWFRFEWQFGVAATVTLLLDITKIVGVYALTQFQFNTTSIVAILTIMGYSINDKVVVYDRVRENLRLYRKMGLRDLVNLSINETLSRTIATSGTVFLAILPLAILAAGEIQEFATVLLIGIVIGTSSSIFIAAPLLLLMGESGRLRRAAPDTEMAHEGRATPKSPGVGAT